jgi:hypothetical protein
MQTHIVLKPSSNVGVTISGTLGTALPTPPTDVVGGIITIESNDVRMRYDGTVPLSTGVDGATLMKKDSIWEITGRDFFTAMRFVPVTSNAYVTVAYISGE